MPDYRLKNGEVVRRRHTYMPCVIWEDRFDAMTPAEQAQVLRDTRWCDLLSERQWEVLLGDTGSEADAKRLAGEVANMLVLLARVAVLNPDLWDQAADRARDKYASQVGDDYPWGAVAIGLLGAGERERIWAQLRDNEEECA